MKTFALIISIVALAGAAWTAGRVYNEKIIKREINKGNPTKNIDSLLYGHTVGPGADCYGVDAGLNEKPSSKLIRVEENGDSLYKVVYPNMLPVYTWSGSKAQNNIGFGYNKYIHSKTAK